MRRPIKTLSLFTGAGGLDIGFHRAGYEVVAAVEIEPAYCRTLRANSAELIVHEQDIRSFDPTPYRGLGVECVIGGPPCQTFSAAGRRSGGVLGTADERGQLFASYCRVLDALQPAVFVFENVYGLPGAEGGRPWREIAEAFSSRGYALCAEVVDAADFGVPQHRERLIMVGYRDGHFRFPLPTHGPDSPSGAPLVSALQAIADLQDPHEPYHQTLGGLYGHLLPLVPEGLNYSFFTKEMGHPEPVFAWRSKFHDLLYKVDRNGPVRTIKARPGKFTGPFHWKNRHFTPAELKRLQGFPDEYEVVGTYHKVVEQIGNSVPPRLAEVVAVSVREQLLDPAGELAYPVRPAHFRSTFRQRQRERNARFHEIAAAEIDRRYRADAPSFAARDGHQQEHVVASGFFARRYEATRPIPAAGESVFALDVDTTGDAKRISFVQDGVDETTAVRISIGIAGLRKYLLHTDTVDVEAVVAGAVHVFDLWAAIEKVLVDCSQFFTLIDIYGHYANRGDTVRVKTVISGGVPEPLRGALEYLGRSDNCGDIREVDGMATELGISRRRMLALVQELRDLRWDIRTAATHATLEDQELICTYPFPLLSEKAHVSRRPSRSA
ncbi:MAG: DNA cytosine methyltransferase [Frankiaceae bacterium]